MPLTNLVFQTVRDLFKRSEQGDTKATQALKSFKNSPDITEASTKGDAKFDSPGLLTDIMETLKLGNQRPALGATPTFAPSRPPIKMEGETDFTQRDPKKFMGMTGDTWKQIAMSAQDGIGGYLRSQGHAAPTGGFAGKWRQEQLDSLAKRHEMWDTAYKSSQTLPPEVITNPEFATLAQAKAALDKDMLDGKVDNEKNVSVYLTELARHKNALDSASMQSKISQQVQGETQLQKSREAAGLALPLEQKNYNFDPDAGGPAPGIAVTPTDYLKMSTDRQQRLEDMQHRRKQLEEQIAGRKEVAAINQGARNDAKAERDMARVLRNVVSQATMGTKEKDPETGEPVGEMGLLKNEGLLVQAAEKFGIAFNKALYASLPPEERAKALAFLIDQFTLR